MPPSDAVSGTLLCGDLGGTKTLLCLYGEQGQRLGQRRFDSGAYAGLEEMAREFFADPDLSAHPRPERAAFGVAGPVEEVDGSRQRARITNLSWSVDTQLLKERLGLARALLVNDFYAVASGVLLLAQAEQPDPARLLSLNPSARPQPAGAIAVLGAGTGLGEAIIARSPAHATPIILASEGGHSDFAARDEVEIELLRFLRRRHGDHVSYERVLCGQGLLELYQFFRQYRGAVPESGPADLQKALAEDPAHAPVLVSQHGLSGDDPHCSEALERFAALLGAEAGNLALKALATGGVYVAGGIAPKIVKVLEGGALLGGFIGKGRFEALLRQIPLHVILDQEIGLLGAYALARAL